jgi:hypothetical protein
VSLAAKSHRRRQTPIDVVGILVAMVLDSVCMRMRVSLCVLESMFMRTRSTGNPQVDVSSVKCECWQSCFLLCRAVKELLCSRNGLKCSWGYRFLASFLLRFVMGSTMPTEVS